MNQNYASPTQLLRTDEEEALNQENGQTTLKKFTHTRTTSPKTKKTLKLFHQQSNHYETQTKTQFIVNAFWKFHYILYLFLKLNIQIFLFIIHIQKAILTQMCCPKTMKRILVLDLDETLIHCTEKRISKKQIAIQLKNQYEVQEMYISIRPYCQRFLQDLKDFYEIYIYTASVQDYADLVLQILDPENNIISKRFYRDSCIRNEHFGFYKDLSNLKIDKKQTIFIDNSYISIVNDQENSFLIPSYTGQETDTELIKYLSILKKFSQKKNEKDIRVLIKNQKQ